MWDAKCFVIQIFAGAADIASKWLTVSLEDRILHALSKKYEENVLRPIFGPMTEEATEGWKKTTQQGTS
jgi:hypothetical protein